MNKNPDKKNSQKVVTEAEKFVTVAVSGGFDPVHIGHVRMFQEARKLGDKLVVILNNDNWLRKKKGFAFMPELERKEIIEALVGVDEVVVTSHQENPIDMSVCAELEKIHPAIFANGGDRTVQDSKNKSSSLSPEAVLCERLHIKMEYNVGRGGKIQSSSDLVRRVKDVHK